MQFFIYYPLKYKKPPIAVITTIIDGGDKGIRTPDLLTASQALSQLSYIPSFINGADDRIRTGDLFLTMEALLPPELHRQYFFII